MSFNVSQGTNISHWLSQSGRRGKERIAYFTFDDIKRIADFGCDHIRIPIDEVQMFYENGMVDSEAFDLLNSALYWCDREQMKAVVDFHILRTHYFNDTSEPKLFTDPSETHRFADLWLSISKQISEWSVNQLAYELLNEPVAKDNESWNRVSNFVFSSLRKSEPKRTILLGSNWFSQADKFDSLLVPDDNYLILTLHYYKPMLLTHHRADWNEIGVYDGPVQYPGKTVPDDVLGTLKGKLRKIVESENSYYDRNVIIDDLMQPLEVREKTGKPLYCSEFGCIKLAPADAMRSWYRDVVSVFNEFGIPFASWDYRGIFGLLDDNRNDRGFAEILFKR